MAALHRPLYKLSFHLGYRGPARSHRSTPNKKFERMSSTVGLIVVACIRFDTSAFCYIVEQTVMIDLL